MNREHLPRLEQIVEALVNLFQECQDRSIQRVYIFGSQLSEPDEFSDVDVLIVRDDNMHLAAVHEASQMLGTRFRDVTGLRLDQTRLTEKELAESRFLGTVTSVKIWERVGATMHRELPD